MPHTRTTMKALRTQKIPERSAQQQQQYWYTPGTWPHKCWLSVHGVDSLVPGAIGWERLDQILGTATRFRRYVPPYMHTLNTQQTRAHIIERQKTAGARSPLVPHANTRREHRDVEKSSSHTARTTAKEGGIILRMKYRASPPEMKWEQLIIFRLQDQKCMVII